MGDADDYYDLLGLAKAGTAVESPAALLAPASEEASPPAVEGVASVDDEDVDVRQAPGG